MKLFKKILAVAIIVTMIACIFAMSTVSSSASGTGAGLTEWCLNAYYSKWNYVYGGSKPGTVDCSGLIYSYAGGHRTGDAQLYNSSYIGYVSNGVPRIHGLGLWKPGHVGVYVGDGMAVDARGSNYGVCYESVYTHGWTKYFKVPGVSYPTNGWVTVNSDKYYYEDGQYVVNTTKTIDGVSYSFGSNGKCTTNGVVDTNTSKEETTTQSSTLKKGSTGDRVVELQERLKELGYYSGPIDGSFGDGTEKAFMLFQAQAGLYVDGLAGSDVDYLYSDDAPKYVAENGSNDDNNNNDNNDINGGISLDVTNKKEDSDLASTGTEAETPEEVPSTFSKGDYHEEVIKLQERLIELNYYSDVADGSFGTMTEEAVIAFQAANGISQTGIADEFTLSVLYSLAAVENPTVEESTMEEIFSEIPEPMNITAVDATEVVLETNQTSEKALSGVASTIGFKADKNGNNFQFIFWLLVMIAVMSVSFVIVQAAENKKRKTAKRYF